MPIQVSSHSNIARRINNLPKEINEDLPSLSSLAVGLATSITTSYFAGSMASGSPSEVKAALIPIISVYSSLLGSATSLIVDKLSNTVINDIESDISSGKIKQS